MTAWYDKIFEARTQGLGEAKKASLRALIEAWAELDPRPTNREIQDYIFPVLPEFKDPADEGWEQARPGNLIVRDIVRVREEAFSGRFKHVEGRVVAIRHGSVSLKALDPEQSDVEAKAFRINQLDKRVAG